MRIAILCDYPIFLLPGVSLERSHSAHYATWLPQLAVAFEEHTPRIQFHWITLSEFVKEPLNVRYVDQVFHILPKCASGRLKRFYADDLGNIRSTLDTINPSLVHGWGSEDVYALAACQSPFRSLVSMQGILHHYILKNRFPLRVYLQALLELYVLRKADSLTVESKWGKRQLSKITRSKRIHLVEYGTHPLWHKTPWQPNSQTPSAIFIGSIHPRKGVRDLIQAFHSPNLRNAELWMVGDGNPTYVNQLKGEASQNVKWLGRKTPDESADLMKQAWCLVLPTRADTSPNVVKEAR
ncbi:MAG: glycosyltransferase family 4 protein, partial [Verrucomicrobiota bacterium]